MKTNDYQIDLREIPLGARQDPRDLRDVIKPRAVAPAELPRSDVEPDVRARTYGQALKVPRYERCTGLEDIRYSIAVEDQSVCVGLPVYDSWYSDPTRRTGRVEMPSLSLMLGRHAMVFCGYDDRKGELLAANCWGRKYGADGFNLVPYEYLEIEGFVDAWTAGFDAIPNPAAQFQRK